MDRSVLIEHWQKTRFAPGDRAQAQRDARTIARFLKDEYGASVIGIGSAFVDERRFKQTSDIDLVVKDLDSRVFIHASAQCAGMTRFDLDVIPYESASAHIRHAADTEGVQL
jgi:predicted nucleotidyltransferase